MKKPKPRNAGTWSEARYFQQIRSHLRNAFRYWKPIQDARKSARSVNDVGLLSEKGNVLKWKFECAHCKGFFGDKDVQVDHVIPCGKLSSLDDVQGFIERLTAEDGYQVLCKECHKAVTLEQKAG